MKPIYKNIIIGVCTVGVTATVIGLGIRQVYVALGKGAGQKEATVADKNEMEIIFVRNKSI